MYELSEADYQQVVGKLTDLLAASIEHLREVGQANRATVLAEQAHDILLSYDDDVAEHVWMAAFGDEESAHGGLGVAREIF